MMEREAIAAMALKFVASGNNMHARADRAENNMALPGMMSINHLTMISSHKAEKCMMNLALAACKEFKRVL